VNTAVREKDREALERAITSLADAAREIPPQEERAEPAKSGS
jgi:hypothetical protein